MLWQTPGGWTGRRSRLGSNKEAFDAEVYAICQPLLPLDQRQESGHRYIVFVTPPPPWTRSGQMPRGLASALLSPPSRRAHTS